MIWTTPSRLQNEKTCNTFDWHWSLLCKPPCRSHRSCGKSDAAGPIGIREFVLAGGLMSYGTDLANLYREMARLVDKIFKGASAADLPIERPNKFELLINLKAAKALGLTFSPSFLATADEVVE